MKKKVAEVIHINLQKIPLSKSKTHLNYMIRIGDATKCSVVQYMYTVLIKKLK